MPPQPFFFSCHFPLSQWTWAFFRTEHLWLEVRKNLMRGYCVSGVTFSIAFFWVGSDSEWGSLSSSLTTACILVRERNICSWGLDCIRRSRGGTLDWIAHCPLFFELYRGRNQVFMRLALGNGGLWWRGNSLWSCHCFSLLILKTAFLEEEIEYFYSSIQKSAENTFWTVWSKKWFSDVLETHFSEFLGDGSF